MVVEYVDLVEGLVKVWMEYECCVLCLMLKDLCWCWLDDVILELVFEFFVGVYVMVVVCEFVNVGV